MKTASRPSQTAAIPPSDAPAARQNDQVMEDSALAVSTWFSGTMLGMTELCAGSKKAAPTVSTRSSG